ncbi:MAG TPA: XrtA system polysaccharide deacetylase [Longimicrobiales bacterium]
MIVPVDVQVSGKGEMKPHDAVSHHFTVDVEEYFQVSAFERWIPRTQWDRLESRVVESTMRVFELLAAHGARATLFILGWVAERHPSLVRELAAAGHEIASHGWDHRRVTQQEPAEFRASVRRSKELLESLAGAPVLGFRAPSFSIVPGREWALDILVEEGYLYDSSLFPVRRPGYGYAGAARDPHWLERPAGRLAEVPPATLRRWGANLPAGGGAYLRLLPYALVRSALGDYERRGVPGTFYIHPWELDPDQPRIDVPLLTRVRHYGGLARTASRVRALLREFRFRPIAETVAAMTPP